MSLGKSTLKRCESGSCPYTPCPCWQDLGDKKWYCEECWDAFDSEQAKKAPVSKKNKKKKDAVVSAASQMADGMDDLDGPATTGGGGGGGRNKKKQEVTGDRLYLVSDRKAKQVLDNNKANSIQKKVEQNHKEEPAKGQADRKVAKMDDPIVTDAHIGMLEPELAAEATIQYSAITAAAADGKGVSSKLRSILEQHGFAIVENVLDAETVQSLEKLWEADLHSIVEVAHADQPVAATAGGGGGVAAPPLGKPPAFLKDLVHEWPAQEDGFSLGHKFASMYGLPHGQCAWATRCNPNVKSVYEDLYQTADLCVGIDNMFFNPTKLRVGTDDTKKTSLLWPHADQNGHVQPEGDWDVFQSVVYLWPAGTDTSATVVWPGSHGAEYTQLMGYSRGKKGHWCMLKKQECGRFAAGARRIPVPSGGMLLWSSKTIHQGWPLGPRLAVPVCFEPATRRPADARRRKIKCVKDGQPTTHWASLGKVHSLAGGTSDEGGSGVVKVTHRAHFHARAKGEQGIKEEIFALL